MRGAQHAQREVVVAAQDRRHRRIPGEVPADRVAAAGSPTALHGRGFGRTGLLQRLPPALGTGAGASGGGGDGHVVHGLVAQGQQMPGHPVGGLAVVGPHPWQVTGGRVDRGLDHAHHRDPGGDRLQSPDAGRVVGDHDQPTAHVGGTLHLRGDGGLLGRFEDAYAHRVGGGTRRLLDAPEDRGVPVVGGVGGEHGHGPVASAGQGERGGVAPETQLVDDGEHPLAGRLPHARVAVDHPGERSGRRPRRPRRHS